MEGVHQTESSLTEAGSARTIIATAVSLFLINHDDSPPPPKKKFAT